MAAIVAGAGLGSAAERDAAEDDAEAGAQGVADAAVTAADAVLGISASGRTPFVVGAIEAAAAAGALTGAVVSAPDSPLAALVDHEIVVVVGPEFLAGSTRLKSGTAQKLVLNTISTVSMVRTGKTFGNLMVDVRATNDKLRARVRRIVELATGASPDEVEAALEAAGGEAKVAIVSLLAEVDADTARSRLDAADGRIRAALELVRLGVEAALVGRELVPGDVEIADGHIGRVGLSSANGKGVASPGFVDLQVNGFGGVDFLDADAAGYRVAGEALLETGVTAYLPTFITAPEEQLVAALAEVPHDSERPHVLGAHLEGPFLAPERLGTHPESARRDPDTDCSSACSRPARCGSSRSRPSSPAPAR